MLAFIIFTVFIFCICLWIWAFTSAVEDILRFAGRVIRWFFGAKSTMGFCFRVIAAGAVVFALALFFADSPKQPAGHSHHPAPIVDGPAYLASEKEAAALAAEPDAEAQPHDDGNGLAVDPDTDPAISPNALAKGLSVVPGAIVCADLETVSMMFDWYAEHWGEQAVDAMTNGQSRLIRSDIPSPVMPPGCALLPAGTPLEVKLFNGIPVVYAKLADGSTIKGVTLGGMVSSAEATASPHITVPKTSENTAR